MTRPRRDILAIAALTAAYSIAGLAGLRLASVDPSATPVWPPTGIALAALVLLGTRAWPGVFAGALIVNLPTAGPWALGIAIGNTTEAVAGAWLVLRFAGGPAALERVTGVLRYVAAACAAAMLSASVGVATLAVAGRLYGPAMPVLGTWWLGDVGGALVAGPAVLLWGHAARMRFSRRELLEALALSIVLGAVGLLLFGGVVNVPEPLQFLAAPVLVWAALRFGPRGTATATAVLSFLAVWGTLRGFGPFARYGANAAFLLLSSFLAVVNVTALALAAAVRELHEARQEVHDIQERLRQAERAQAAAALAEAQALAHIGSWGWDVETGTITWSDELYRLFGLASQSVPITFEAFMARVHPGDRETLAATIERSRTGGEPFLIDHRVVWDDGSTHWVRARGSVIGQPATRMFGTSQDITESRRVEQVRRGFIGNAAHELRTPLTAMIGISDLLGRYRPQLSEEEMTEYCDVLQRQGDRARRLVTALLDLSHLEQGLLPLQLQRVPLAEVAARAVTASAPPASSHVTVEVPAEATAVADPLRLEEVIVNLLINAYRYGGHEVRLSATSGDATVRLAVSDDGAGVGDDLLPHLFEPFTRGRASRDVEGSGLGLAITRGLAEAQGGRLWYERADPGARFVVELRAV